MSAQIASNRNNYFCFWRERSGKESRKSKTEAFLSDGEVCFCVSSFKNKIQRVKKIVGTATCLSKFVNMLYFDCIINPAPFNYFTLKIKIKRENKKKNRTITITIKSTEIIRAN